VFLDITPYSPVKVNRRFGGKCRLHLSVKSKTSKKPERSRQQAELLTSCWFLAWLSLRPWRYKRNVLLKRWLTFSGLHCIIFQYTSHLKIVLYHGHPCGNFCCVRCFEVRRIAKCIEMVVYSRLIARGEVCGPLVGRGLISFLISIRRSWREWVKERISKEIASEQERKVYREDI
jgi:hypothetical protein